jgi:hypothetical protein
VKWHCWAESHRNSLKIYICFVDAIFLLQEKETFNFKYVICLSATLKALICRTYEVQYIYNRRFTNPLKKSKNLSVTVLASQKWVFLFLGLNIAMVFIYPHCPLSTSTEISPLFWTIPGGCFGRQEELLSKICVENHMLPNVGLYPSPTSVTHLCCWTRSWVRKTGLGKLSY